MSGQTEDLEMRFAIDGSGAQASLDHMREAGLALGGSIGKLNEVLGGMAAKQDTLARASENVRKKQTEQGAAFTQALTPIEKLRQKYHDVTGPLDKIGGKSGADARQAVGSLAFAMGNASGTGSSFLNVIGDLAGALSGGPLAIGLVAVGAGVAAFAGKAMEAKKALKDFDDSILNAGRTGLKEYLGALNDVTVKLDELGKKPGEIAIGKAEFDLDQAQTTRLFYEEDAKRQKERIAAVEYERTKRKSSDLEVLKQQNTEIEDAKRLLALDTERAAIATQEVARTKEILDKTNKLVERSEARAATEKAAADLVAKNKKDEEAMYSAFDKRAAAHAKADTDAGAAAAKAAQAEAAARKKAEDDMYRALDRRSEKFYKDKADTAKFYSDALVDIEADGLAGQADLWKQRNDVSRTLEEMRLADLEASAAKQKAIAQEVAAYTTQAMGIGIGATQTLIEDMITGQDHALEHFATSVMAQAGQALIGHGVNLGGAAVVSGLTGNLPLAAAQGAGAAGLVAGGIALGGVAAGWDHVVAGGTLGQKLPSEKAKNDRGVNGRSGSSRGGGSASGGDTIINISANYGLGVSEEHTHQHLADTLDRMVSRGVTPRVANIGGRR